MKNGSNKHTFWFLASVALPIAIGAFVFNIFHYSTAFGFAEINSLNAILFAPFIVLIYALGMSLRDMKGVEDFQSAYVDKISDREREVIHLIVQGRKNREISSELYIEISTVKTHINNIYRKMGVKNRKELIAAAKYRSSKGSSGKSTPFSTP